MRKRITIALTAVFLAFVLAITCATLIKSGRNFAYGFFKSYTDYLPEDPDVFDNVSARIRKLDYNAENRLFGKKAFNHAYAALQMGLGKQVISVNGSDMVRLTGGGWYNLFSGEITAKKAEEVVDFAHKAEEICGAKTVFAYCHCALFEDGLLPGDTALLDNNTEFADAVLQTLREGGVPVLDSRDSYLTSGLTIDEAANKSDVHWSHRMALAATRDTVRLMNSEFGFDMDDTALDSTRFTDETYENLLAGVYAERLGYRSEMFDDVHLLYPSYETHITYEELNEDMVRREGSFREAMVTEKNLEKNKGKDYSTNAYYIYGHYLAQTHTHNEDAADLTVLVFKDSYGTPMSAYLALAAKDVYAVDLRSTKESEFEWLERVQPDVVVFAYSQQMLRDFEYVIDG